MSEPVRTSAYDPVATQRWIERFSRFANANCSVAAFCAAEGVSKAGFFSWKRRLAPTQHTNNSKPTTPNKPAVVPLRVATATTPGTAIELALPSGAVLRFPLDTRPELIVAILRGLEQRSC